MKSVNTKPITSSLEEEKLNASTSRGSGPPPEPDEDKKPKGTSPRPGPSTDQYFEAQRVFALLIGIDSYDLPGANLGGCVKDSRQVEQYLREQTDNASERLYLMTLRSPLPSDVVSVMAAPAPASHTEGKPSRQGIIDAFMGFLTQATENDVVFIHYSGHGSYETRPAELWHLDAEESSKHRAETLVCQDSYTKDRKGDYIPALRDKEIRWLLHKVAEKNPHIVLLMDCCNASGNTRFKEDGTQARFTPTVGSRNGIDTYIFYQEDPMAKEVLSTNPTAFFLPEGRHVALYAGHSYQLAKETSFEEGRFGVFSYYLLQTLRATKGNISYRDLLKIVRNKASQAVADQSPQWYVTERQDLDFVFLGGATADNSPAYTLTPTDQTNEGRLDAGSLHGLLGPSLGKTYFTVFAADQDVSELTPENTRQAELISLTPDHSILRFMDGKGFPAGTELLKAIVKASPLSCTKVCIDLEIDEELAQLEAIADTNLKEGMQAAKVELEDLINASQHLELVEKSAGGWQFHLFIYRYEGLDKLRIAEKDNVAARIAPMMGWRERSLMSLVAKMNHIAKWERTLALTNPQPVVLQPGLVELQAIGLDGNVVYDHGGEIVLDANGKDLNQPALKFKVKLKKPYNKPLYCALMRLSPDFGVDPDYLEPDAHLGTFEYMEDGNRIKYDNTEIYAGSHIVVNGQRNPAGLYRGFAPPQSTGDLEVKEFVYYMKLMVSTEEFSANYLYQDDLDRPNNTRMGRAESPNNQLEGMLQEVQVRNDGWVTFAAARPAKISDWWTSTIKIVVKT